MNEQSCVEEWSKKCLRRGWAWSTDNFNLTTLCLMEVFLSALRKSAKENGCIKWIWFFLTHVKFFLNRIASKRLEHQNSVSCGFSFPALGHINLPFGNRHSSAMLTKGAAICVWLPDSMVSSGCHKTWPYILHINTAISLDYRSQNITMALESWLSMFTFS